MAYMKGVVSHVRSHLFQIELTMMMQNSQVLHRMENRTKPATVVMHNPDAFRGATAGCGAIAVIRLADPLAPATGSIG